MKKKSAGFLSVGFFIISITSYAQSPDSIVLKDINWDKNSSAGMTELFIPSEKSVIAGFIYTANGQQKHPTLIMLHGYPGNERNLDLAQVVRAHGWNVVYFDYRGSWGSGGQFSFANCVQDVVNVVAFCKKNAGNFHIDTSNIVLFGHSMGGWVCLKALQQLPGISKGFALSTWDIYSDLKNVKTEQQLSAAAKESGEYFVLNTPTEQILKPVTADPDYYNLQKNTSALSGKQIIMLDEHTRNKQLATILQKSNHNYFDYEVWQTDHPFTNKRISLINKVLAFLDK
jgi:pimeloyl-ACP methyl ester carboxylesterase